MYANDIIEVICEVNPQLNAGDINEKTSFELLGLSSLQLTEVILELEDKYDIEIEVDTVDANANFKTIGDLSAALDSIIKAKDA